VYSPPLPSGLPSGVLQAPDHFIYGHCHPASLYVRRRRLLKANSNPQPYNQAARINMPPGPVIVPIRDGSDGDASHQPNRTTYQLVDPPTIYLEKIGSLWMNHLGKARQGEIQRPNSRCGKLPNPRAIVSAH
jgi:hypothetical protein